MSSACCEFGGPFITTIPQPGDPFVLTGLCDHCKKAYGNVAANVAVTCHQIVAMLPDGTLTTDLSDPTLIWGIAVKDTPADPAGCPAPFWVMGTFDGEQAVLAGGVAWNDPAVLMRLREIGIYLEARAN